MDELRRDECAITRLTRAERGALMGLAALERVKISEAIRLALREAAKARGLWPPAAPSTQPTAAGEGVRA